MTAVARYTMQELLSDSEDIASVLLFLACMQPLRGSSHDDDQRLEHGRSLILRWLAASTAGPSAPFIEKADEEGIPQEQIDLATLPRDELIYECAEVVYFLRNLERSQSKPEHPDHPGDAECGYCRIMDWIDARLLRACGRSEDRPHETTGEQLEQAYAVHDAAEERKALEGKLQ